MNFYQPLSSLSEEPENNILNIDYAYFERAAIILKALNHKFRQHLLKAVYTNEPVSVTKIHLVMHVEQSVASLHLAILRRAGIVSVIRDGKYNFYSVNYKRIKEISQFAKALMDTFQFDLPAM